MPTLEQVKELRARTGCGVVDCQQALAEAGDDVEQAVMLLRKRGVIKAAKKADRATHEGTVATYVHGNKIAAVVALQCETDFVGRNGKFQELARNIALHIAASDPLVVRPEDVPEGLVAQEEAIAQEQAAGSGKPAEIQAKMVVGKLKAFREERALLTQPYVKDPGKTVNDLINEAIQELGENISVGEFKRIAL